ncbi:amino acid ABC transporter ATP-binding protein [Sporomusa sphaeroides]|uniref:Glutamine transport ATP-binding protein GlnQ n=2 Tax=Sporomusa TaxID=2375 RepID=A0ABP2C3Y3_9FIRM|nr:amino acid ABC transporter ATP-binding protein [Sporomusa sphaeroides]OLS56228.1 glutamine transport ATP-binding protein GlnQ [Sporomusa sphaeroides DSM 2875]CVK19130.1 Glutamine transport ATP-binding protein GlnQ [Sporomusa sphaeroides DSM 2875]SCM82499.1 Glutamine transport ATP-binding protein GlnQ [uncultured Sporomusa sp.]HML33956.1 amino acid ABC transporter ATP-binding protein [Sporomusa sphaeroides]
MLVIQNLYKQFGSLVAVNDFNLTVKLGETVVLMGPSGCGKSTTIRTINRLVEPSRGRVMLNGANILAMEPDELRDVRKRIGFVFQHFNLIGRLTTLENVMLGLVMGGTDRETAECKATEALTKVGLENHLAHRPDQLSGGQQQRVGIARALAYEPELMLWDEPTASLDPILVREVLVVMEELARYRASTMIVVTHELTFALRVADRIVLMDKGSIVEEGQPSEVFVKPVSDIGRQYQELIEYQMNTQAQSLAGKR